MIDWARILNAAEVLAEVGNALAAQAISLAEAHDSLDAVSSMLDRTKVDIAVEIDRLHALIGG